MCCARSLRRSKTSRDPALARSDHAPRGLSNLHVWSLALPARHVTHRLLADSPRPGQCLLEPDDAEVPGTPDRQVANRPQVRNGAEFDACSHVAADEIIESLDVDRLDCGVADPLSRRIRPRAEHRSVEAVSVQHGGREDREPSEFDRMNPFCNRAECLAELVPLDCASWPGRHARAVARKPVERRMFGVDGPDRRRLAGVRGRNVRREPPDRRIGAEMEEFHTPDPGTHPRASPLQLDPMAFRWAAGVTLSGVAIRCDCDPFSFRRAFAPGIGGIARCMWGD